MRNEKDAANEQAVKLQNVITDLTNELSNQE